MSRDLNQVLMDQANILEISKYLRVDTRLYKVSPAFHQAYESALLKDNP